MKVHDRNSVLTVPTDDVYELLETRREGLSQEEVQQRLEQFGRNEVERAKAYPVWKIIVDQVASPLIYVLIGAGIVTFLLRDYVDSAVIFAVVLLNGVIGGIQEYRASRAIEALRELEAPVSKVRRNGKAIALESAEIVPGDVVLLEAGTRVSADLRLVRCNELRADESLLTGESLPVEKTADALDDPQTDLAETYNFVFGGSMLIEGRGEAVAVSTGTRSELGKIAKAVSEVAKVDTPLQHRLHILANQITIAIGIIGVVFCILGYMQGIPLKTVIFAAVALAVAAIPEGLPVVVTVVLSIGVKRMANRNALVRKLPAVETMGSTEVICTDKTGTLTQNHMKVHSIVLGPWHLQVKGDSPVLRTDTKSIPGFCEPEDQEDVVPSLHKLLRVASYCNNAEYSVDPKGRSQFSGNPTEVALLESTVIFAADLMHQEDESTPLSEVPFSSSRKFMASVHRINNEQEIVLLAKGSPEVMLERSEKQWSENGEQELAKQCWLDAAEALAEDGQRVIGLAQRSWDKSSISEDDVYGLTFMGLIGIIDPPRPEVPEAVHQCQQSGLRTVMITGDHPATARAIARQVGIINHEEDIEEYSDIEEDPRVMTGRQLDATDDDALAERLEDISVYARVTPAHKLRIVEQFQRKNKVVAVTGDGVNDAPALRRAHIGVAMGKSGTDAAREASDVVLLDDSFASIFEAVKEGRYIFENIRKVILFLVSSGIGLSLAMLAFLAIGLQMFEWFGMSHHLSPGDKSALIPFTASMILWINLVTNGLQDVALAFEPGEKSVLRRKSYGLEAPIFHKHVLQHMFVVAFVFGIGIIFAYFYSLNLHGEVAEAQTSAATMMVMFQMWHAYSCRSITRSIFKVPIRDNMFLLISTVLATIAQILFIYWGPMQSIFKTQAIHLEDWLVLLPISFVGVLAMEISKWFIRRRGEF